MASVWAPHDLSELPPEAQSAVIELWTLQGIAMVIVGLRFYARLSTSRSPFHLGPDDWLMAGGISVHTIQLVGTWLLVVYCIGLSNSGMDDDYRASLAEDPESVEWALRVAGSKIHVVTKLLYITTLWLLKSCWVVYYHRMTDNVLHTRLFIRAASILVPVTYVMCLMVALLKCQPFASQWQIDPNPGDSCLPAISVFQTVFVMCLNTSTDLFLIAIPLPVVWTARLPTIKKVYLAVMFSGGFLQIAFSILRCVNILKLGRGDPSLSAYWSVRESFVAIVLTNMPVVYPFVRHQLRRLGALLGFQTATTSDGHTTTGGDHCHTHTHKSHGYRLGSRAGTVLDNMKSGTRGAQQRISLHAAGSESRAKLAQCPWEAYPPPPPLPMRHGCRGQPQGEGDLTDDVDFKFREPSGDIKRHAPHSHNITPRLLSLTDVERGPRSPHLHLREKDVSTVEMARLEKTTTNSSSTFTAGSGGCGSPRSKDSSDSGWPTASERSPGLPMQGGTNRHPHRDSTLPIQSPTRMTHRDSSDDDVDRDDGDGEEEDLADMPMSEVFTPLRPASGAAAATMERAGGGGRSLDALRVRRGQGDDLLPLSPIQVVVTRHIEVHVDTSSPDMPGTPKVQTQVGI